MKLSLKALKLNRSINNGEEIVFFSKLIRSLIKNNCKINGTDEAPPTEEDFVKKIRPLCNRLFNKITNAIPTFLFKTVTIILRTLCTAKAKHSLASRLGLCL